MTNIWAYTLISIFITSLLSFIGVLWLFLSNRTFDRLIFILVSISAGTLFGDAFIHLIPESLEHGMNATSFSLAVLLGLLVFFALEKFLHWKHSHAEGTTEEHPENHIKPLAPMVLISDAIHNFIDGILIAGSFLISIPVGIATTLAVFIHEIPQEISDFVLLVHSGVSKARALFLNFVSSLSAILGGIIALILGSRIEGIVPFIVAVGAGSFIYIAGSDLLPELHKTKDPKKSLVQFFSIILGILIMYLLLLLE